MNRLVILSRAFIFLCLFAHNEILIILFLLYKSFLCVIIDKKAKEEQIMKLLKQNMTPLPGKTMPRTGKAPSGHKQAVSDVSLQEKLLRDEAKIYNELDILMTVVQAMEEVPEDVTSPQDIFALLNGEYKAGWEQKDFYHALQDELGGFCLHDNLTDDLKQTIFRIKSPADAGKALDKAMSGIIEQEEKTIVPPSSEARRIMRLAFNGFVERQNGSRISEVYAEYLNTRDASRQYRLEDYNLEESAVWQAMKQQSAFKNFDKAMKKAFAKMNVPPELAVKMPVSDIEQIVFDDFSRGNQFKRKVHVFNGAKNVFCEILVNNHEKDLKSLLGKMGVDEAEFENVTRFMRENSQFPPLIKAMDGSWIEASIHHKENIKDANDYAAVNAIDNFVTIFDRVDDKKSRQKISSWTRDASSEADNVPPRRIPRIHDLLHRRDEPLGKAYRRRKNAEKRNCSEEWKPRRIKETVMREETIRRLRFKKDVCCVGGLSNGMSFSLTEKDALDYENKIGQMKDLGNFVKKKGRGIEKCQNWQRL